MRETPTAGLVVIGNEILSGKVTDANTPFLARELRSLGVSLERVTIIPDEIDTVASVVADFAARFDLVFTSGGVGPTHDDVTMEGIAKAFDREVVEHPGLRAAIEKFVGSRVNDAHLKMARVPDGCELVTGDHAAFPTIVVGNVYVLPGIPEIFQDKIVSLRDRFRTQPYHLRQVLVRENETGIAEFLNATLAAFPELLLGSYPKLAHPEYRVRLTLESKDESYLERALADLIERLPDGYVVRIEP
ncbi:MAG TPA: molybdopterin-binding protein [Candidatus Limnocylindrales bacterium]|nr:molybdopterin-binding protein [Candidatus Limnocylindrales bacterium]